MSTIQALFDDATGRTVINSIDGWREMNALGALTLLARQRDW